MIGCAEALHLMDDHVDGALGAALDREVRAHLADCPACRGAESEIRRLLDAAAELPAEVAPPRDLWPAIAGRLRAEIVQVQGARRRRRALAAVAAALLLTAATVLLTARFAREPRRPEAGAILPAALPEDAGATSDVAAAFAEYERAAAALRSALARRAAARPAAEAGVITENLAIVDDAVARLKSALADDPDSPGLAMLLASAYRRQIDLLSSELEKS